MSRARGPGPKSIEALEWLARVDVSGLVPLGCALGFGWRATYSHVERLAGAGLVVRICDRGGSVVAITRKGRRAVDADPGDVRAGATNGFGLAHSRAMSWVAVYLTLRGRSWLGERELFGDDGWKVPVIWSGGYGTHRPDLVASVNDRMVAIEVELTPKAPRRLRAIMAGYAEAIRLGRFSVVTYVTARDDVTAGVTRAAESAWLPDSEFSVQPFAGVQAMVRDLAGNRAWPGAGR